MFNLINGWMELVGASVLDLFAGSGALGLEACSRGAASACFVEKSRAAARVAESNAQLLGVSARVLAVPAKTAVARPLPFAPFDLVLADPPYDLDVSELNSILELLVGAGNVSASTVIVLEMSVGELGPSWPKGWEETEERRYGGTVLRFGCAAR